MTKNEQIKREFKDLLDEAIAEPGIISECYRQFHDYSLANLMEIAIQCRMNGLKFGPAAGLKKWNEKGRMVKKGQHRLWIWFPMFSKFPKDVVDENGNPVIGSDGKPVVEWIKYVKGFDYKPGVFVIDQTEGKDIEWPETPEWDKDQMIEGMGITVVDFEYPNGNVQGYAEKGKKVAVNPVAEHPLRTLIHEVAHVLLGHTEDNRMVDGERIEYSDGEMEAEGVAYLVCYALGLPGAEQSRGYIQNWMGDRREYSDKMAQRIFGTANKILCAGRVS